LKVRVPVFKGDHRGEDVATLVGVSSFYHFPALFEHGKTRKFIFYTKQHRLL
jgi:hypothetical protein